VRFLWKFCGNKQGKRRKENEKMKRKTRVENRVNKNKSKTRTNLGFDDQFGVKAMGVDFTQEDN